MNELAISLSIGNQPIEPQIEKIIQNCERIGVDSTIVVLAGHSKLDPKGCEMAINAEQVMPGTVVTALANEGTFSSAYLTGWQKGAEVGEYVISMDADGSHDPQDISKFLAKFRDGHNAVMSSRFVPESKNLYPFQRKIVSYIGTIMSNYLLVPSGMNKLTDFTSGFEGLHRDIIKDIFETHSISNWICATEGPYHLQNTELRMRVMQSGYNIEEVPITYGAKRKGKNLKFDYLFQAAYGFTLLLKNRK